MIQIPSNFLDEDGLMTYLEFLGFKKEERDDLSSSLLERFGDEVHDVHSLMASTLNNSGLSTQMKFLVKSVGKDRVIELINEEVDLLRGSSGETPTNERNEQHA